MSTKTRDGTPIRELLKPRLTDLGEFKVRRVLPAESRQRVGAFIFFDHMGPAVFPPGHGVAVRPHPHIGLATVTYLFEGEIVHRDSLGHVQPIQPGAVNWMTAGRGIVHSERTSEALTASGSKLHGIQTWMALPAQLEEIEPSFVHYPAPRLPEIHRPGITLRVIAGEAFGERSPVATVSPTLYLEVDMTAGAVMETAFPVGESAVYVVLGRVKLGERSLEPGVMAVLNSPAELTALEDAKVMVIGGEALPGERFLYWNLVSSSRERIEQAKRDWRDGRFPGVPGETEFIPLPED